MTQGPEAKFRLETSPIWKYAFQKVSDNFFLSKKKKIKQGNEMRIWACNIFLVYFS